MRSYLFGYGGTASEAQEYVTHQRHDFRYRNSDSILVYVEFATVFGGTFHRQNFRVEQGYLIVVRFDNVPAMLLKSELSPSGLIKDIFCLITWLHLVF
jgi:hypothetical protein